MIARLCTFCGRDESNRTPWCVSNPGAGCTYGLGHEFPPREAATKKQTPKVDKWLCVKCGLHVRNPASGTNGCVHEYPGEPIT